MSKLDKKIEKRLTLVKVPLVMGYNNYCYEWIPISELKKYRKLTKQR